MELNDRESSLLIFAIGAAAGACTRADDQDLAKQLLRLFKAVAGIPDLPVTAPDPGEGHSQLDEMPADEPPVKPAKAAAAKATKKATRGKKR